MRKKYVWPAHVKIIIFSILAPVVLLYFREPPQRRDPRWLGHALVGGGLVVVARIVSGRPIAAW